ncbi:MAG TPA: hypothetical protein VK524_14830 [Polyangiaceae bacterium]|nr:hypothetical protein [Polyangiaceae bacterium]
MALGCALSGLLPACKAERISEDYSLLVQVQSDPGRALAGAVISLEHQKIGESNEQGRAQLTIRGKEGEKRELEVTCPKGYKSPSAAIRVFLHRTSNLGKVAEYQAACKPLTRSVVVIVRADKGPALPVRYLGGEVARTDASGAAHVLLAVAPESDIELVLDTSGNSRLRPRSPSARFVVRDRDEVFVLNQSFEQSRPVIVRAARPSEPDVPQEIRSTLPAGPSRASARPLPTPRVAR